MGGLHEYPVSHCLFSFSFLFSLQSVDNGTTTSSDVILPVKYDFGFFTGFFTGF